MNEKIKEAINSLTDYIKTEFEKLPNNTSDEDIEDAVSSINSAIYNAIDNIGCPNYELAKELENWIGETFSSVDNDNFLFYATMELISEYSIEIPFGLNNTLLETLYDYNENFRKFCDDYVKNNKEDDEIYSDDFLRPWNIKKHNWADDWEEAFFNNIDGNDSSFYFNNIMRDKEAASQFSEEQFLDLVGKYKYLCKFHAED